MKVQTATPSAPMIMPDAGRWPTTCGRLECAHLACIRWREQARRRCYRCDGLILPGARFIEYRDPHTRDLNFQEHCVCPTVPR